MHINLSKFNFVTFLSLTSLLGCNQEVTKIPVVYVAGFESLSQTNQVYSAKYWKNGVVTPLSDGKINNLVFSIYVSNNHVYCAGLEKPASSTIAKIWEDGEVSILSPGKIASASCIFVKENEVYVAGRMSTSAHDVALFWKNGEATILSDSTSQDAVATEIALDGNDVFVSGSIDGQPVVWKNGMMDTLSSNGAGVTTTSSLFIHDHDVFVSGFTTNGFTSIARYWKNGTEVILPGTNSLANSIFVENADVYVCGKITDANRKTNAVYWKNGSMISLTDGTNDSNATSMVVLGSDIYIAGFERNGLNSEVKYWKNGTPTSLTHSSTYSNAFGVSIFVQ